VTVVSGVLVLASLTGCMTWRSVPDAMYRPAGHETVGSVRIVLTDGSRHSLRGVVARTDSVVGFESGQRRAFPHTQVTRIDQRDFQLGRTLLLVGSALVLTYVAATAIAIDTLGDQFEASPSPMPAVP
jgi:hypothetical protein